MYAVGTWYVHGVVVRKSYKEAVRYVRMTAELGSRDAIYELALCNEKGHGVKKSLFTAFKFYREAAQGGT